MVQERVVVRLEHDPVSLLVDVLLDEKEKSADVDVLPLWSPRFVRSRTERGSLPAH
jgi:hypothetical protein